VDTGRVYALKQVDIATMNKAEREEAVDEVRHPPAPSQPGLSRNHPCDNVHQPPSSPPPSPVPTFPFPSPNLSPALYLVLIRHPHSSSSSSFSISSSSSSSSVSPRHQARVLAGMDSKFVIKYYDCFLEDGKLNIVMQYAPNGTLHSRLQGRAALQCCHRYLVKCHLLGGALPHFRGVTATLRGSHCHCSMIAGWSLPHYRVVTATLCGGDGHTMGASTCTALHRPAPYRMFREVAADPAARPGRQVAARGQGVEVVHAGRAVQVETS